MQWKVYRIAVRIDLLYLADCPNRDRARQRLDEALAATAVEASVTETEVSTPKAAALVGMRGSPTLLVDGRDPFATDAPGGSLACRRYRTGDTLDTAPSVAQLIDLLIDAESRS